MLLEHEKIYQLRERRGTDSCYITQYGKLNVTYCLSRRWVWWCLPHMCLCAGFSVQGLLSVPIECPLALFLVGIALYLFATTSIGIFMGTIACLMPQFGLLLMLLLLPLQMLSSWITPRESMPDFVQVKMQAAPITHFVSLAQAILCRGAGLDVVCESYSDHDGRVDRRSLLKESTLIDQPSGTSVPKMGSSPFSSHFRDGGIASNGRYSQGIAVAWA